VAHTQHTHTQDMQ